MRRIAIATLVAACSVGVSFAQADNGEHKVLLCHATSSAGNPYELISVDRHGAAGHLKAGHGVGDQTDFYPEGSDCTGGPGDGGEL
jgi:hypothetical protein